MKRTPQTLADTLARYVASQPLAARTIRNLRENVGSLQRFEGRPLALAELTDGLLNAWIAAQQARGCRVSTIRCRLQSVLTLWKFAYAAGWHAGRPEALIDVGRARKGKVLA